MTPLERASQALQKAADEKNRRRLQDERQYLVGTIGKDLVKEIAPAMEQMVRDNGIALNRAIDSIKQVKMPSVVIPDINVPEPKVQVDVDLSSLKIPAPQITVNPNVRLPDIKFPETQKIEGWVNLMGVSMEKPLPVTLRNADGSPANLFENLTTLVNQGGGNSAKIVKVSGVLSTVGVVTIDPDGNPTYTTSSSGSGSTTVSLVNVDGTYYDSDNPLPVTFSAASVQPVSQVSGATWSVSVNDIFRTTVTSNLINSDDRIRVSVETGGSGLTDSELRAASIDVQQASGASWSVSVTGSITSTGAYLLDGDGNYRGVVATEITDPAGNILDLFKTGDNFVEANDYGVLVYGVVDTTTANYMRPLHMHDVQEDGGNDSIVTVSTSGHDKVYDSAAATWNRTRGNSGYSGPGVMRVVHATDVGVSTSATQVGTWNIGTVTTVTGITNTVAASLIDSTGVQYSGSNPVPVNLATALDLTIDSISAHQVSGSNFSVYVTGSSGTTMVVGLIASDVADDGHAPVKTGAIARTANPTAVAAGDVVSNAADDLGRQIMRPVQVRDLIATAYVAVTNGTETTLLAAGGAGVFHDLVFIEFSNNSTAAVGVDLRSVTAGSVEKHYEIPANGTVGGALPVPWPQGSANNNWTIDLPDVTGTTVTASGLFSKEV